LKPQTVDIRRFNAGNPRSRTKEKAGWTPAFSTCHSAIKPA